MPRYRSALFLFLYVIAVAYICIYPWVFQSIPHAHAWYWVPLDNRRLQLDFVLNVLLYIPLGVAIFTILGGRGYGIIGASTAGFAMSYAVEWTQRYIPHRAAQNLDDLTSNTLGAFMGAIIVLAWRKRVSPATVLGSLWLIWNGFLLLPAVNGAPLPTEGLDAAMLWIGSINAFLGFWALSSSPQTRSWTPAVLAFAPVVTLWIYPSLALARVAAAGAGLLVAHYHRPRLIFIGPACLLWLAFQELYPFHWHAQPQDFSWVPFETLFVGRPQTYYPLIFGKLFFYTTVIWAMRSTKWSWLWACCIPAGVLAVGEAAQIYLPGRTPEITDFALLFGGTFLLWMVEEDPAVLEQRTMEHQSTGPN